MPRLVKTKRMNKKLTEDYVSDDLDIDLNQNSNSYEKDNNIPEIIDNNINTVINTNIKSIIIIYIKQIIHYLFHFIKIIIKISSVYVLWIILHFVSSHLYIKFCVPSSFVGFIISPFMTSSPHCQGLRWIIYNAANTINHMWVILGTWLCSYLLQLGNKNNDE